MAKDNSKPFTIFVEGNIGSGKTTFLKHFAALGNVTTLAEPVEKWRAVRGENFLVRCLSLFMKKGSILINPLSFKFNKNIVLDRT